MIKKFIAKNCTHMLTGLGVIGIVATAVLTGQAAVKANYIIRKEEENMIDNDEWYDLRLIDKAKLTWKCFIPPVVVGTLTIASFVSGHVIDVKRLQDMTNAYILSKDAFARYREEVTDWVGEEHEGQIDERSKERRKDEPKFDKNKMITFIEPITNQTFKATPADIIFAEGKINKMFWNNNACSYGYFLKSLGLSVPNYVKTKKIGWWLDDTYSWDSSFYGNWIGIEYCKVPGKDYYELIFDHCPMEPDEPEEWTDYINWER